MLCKSDFIWATSVWLGLQSTFRFQLETFHRLPEPSIVAWRQSREKCEHRLLYPERLRAGKTPMLYLLDAVMY